MSELRWLPKVAEGEMCPACGTHDPDPYRINLRDEHGERDYAPYDTYEGETGMVCSVMHTVRNHCIYHARRIVDPKFRSNPDRCYVPGHPRGGHKVFDMACAAEKLAIDIERAAEVWPADRQGWLDRYRLLASDSPAGQAARLTAAVMGGAR